MRTAVSRFEADPCSARRRRRNRHFAGSIKPAPEETTDFLWIVFSQAVCYTEIVAPAFDGQAATNFGRYLQCLKPASRQLRSCKSTTKRFLFLVTKISLQILRILRTFGITFFQLGVPSNSSLCGGHKAHQCMVHQLCRAAHLLSGPVCKRRGGCA